MDPNNEMVKKKVVLSQQIYFDDYLWLGNFLDWIAKSSS